ncbi:protealysin inhibitor emfourin [Streptomyces oceani]|uniref:Metalloprotease n=1 Tax=Streptomyces oceani TaxID=1075402 RepID=A0A1E7KFK0_9ACTN|nr:protealysin inhibitor emfourin [Streptomyces oceani]OEV02701.1 metalloprotease [Streptomyces oceani]
MRITVTRSGGFGGQSRRATLETQHRTDAEELTTLAQHALAEGRRERPLGVPDGFHYEIECDGTATYCADPRLSTAQRALITRVLKEGA